MDHMSSTTRQECQAPLHLHGQALLYRVGMTPTELGHRIRKARLARKLSLAKLGDLMDVSRQLVHQWENAESDPKKHIGELCRILQVPYEYFHGEVGEASDSLEAKVARLTPDNRAAIAPAVDALLSQQKQQKEQIKIKSVK